VTPPRSLIWFTTLVLATFAVSVALTWVTRSVVRRIGFVAKPRAERWHRKPTALAGGVGIFIAFSLSMLMVEGIHRMPLVLGGAAMFALGLVDDVLHLKPYAKLLGQLVIAALTVMHGPSLPWTLHPVLNQAISVFWIVGITNALNLLDNMDGLATGTAAIAALFQTVFFLILHQPAQAAAACALAGALLGFLIFNWNPASIFMGDCGALFIGYTLASLAMESSYGRSRSLLATIAMPVLVMLVPIFDTTFVTMVRIVRGRPVSQGGRDHTSHRLVTLGLSERAAVSSLLTLGALGGVVAVLAHLNIMVGVWIAAPLVAVMLAFIGIHLARTDRPVEDGSRVTLLSAMTAFGYRRRVFEVILDALLAMIALVSAFALRFDGRIPEVLQIGLVRIFLVAVSIKITSLYISKAYDGLWRYAGVEDLVRLVFGAALGSLVTFCIVGIWLQFQWVSRGALIIDAILFAALLAGSRLSFRLVHHLLTRRSGAVSQGTRVILWGAGDLGEGLARRLLDEKELGLIPVGFVDEDPLKRGRLIHGLPVYGHSGNAVDLVGQGAASIVIVTSPRIDADRIAELSQRLGAGRVRRLRLLLEDAVSTRATASLMDEVELGSQSAQA
jgi:UDP-GlcNAc:undecaprenyl-phosphate/decaprenyl-phosphate GlcNAc-1-phosphate transferase